MFPRINTRVLYTALSFILIILGTVAAIQYAKGRYRISPQGFVQGTGLLSANSFPTGAEVMIDGKLVTATDDTLYLQPGNYEVEISKDGYTPWKKTLTIEPELVAQTNALLFPVAPSLSTLTFTGIQNTSPSPDGRKILYYTASQSAQRKNGLYVMELGNDTPISFQNGPRQIAEDIDSLNFEEAQFIWSPDSSEVMVITETKEFLLPVDRKSDIASLLDISFQKQQILREWEQEMYLRERQFLREFPAEVIQIATESAKNVYISPDKKRLLYTATAAVTIPDTIVPPVPATNTQPEERNLQPGTIYVYDREEDKNFRLAQETVDTSAPFKTLLAHDLYNVTPVSLTASASAFETLQASTSAQTAANFNRYHTSLYTETLQWFPDSKHFLFVQDNAIKIVEYDGTNVVSLYSGPFEKNFIYPWPDGSRLVISTKFSLDAPLNLYAIELE
ncbi:MAG: hypothetical protein QG639_321 [Patescibacteria group bacterium]|jgi:hypothetical protein|nr:hypothetical protein [Patescibacteria group bacterium]